MFKKFSSVLLLLLLMNLNILIDPGRGDCTRSPSDGLRIGCADRDPKALIQEVRFEYRTNDAGEYLSNGYSVTYIIRLGTNIPDNTKGTLTIYTPEELIPGNPSPKTRLETIGPEINNQGEIRFEFDLAKLSENELFLGNASNSLWIRGGEGDRSINKEINFHGPFVMINFKQDDTVKSNDNYIKYIIMSARAVKDMNLKLIIKDKDGRTLYSGGRNSYSNKTYNMTYAELDEYNIEKPIKFKDTYIYALMPVR
jgi:hypothetical protein